MEKLNKFVQLLNIDYNSYLQAMNEFEKDSKKAIQKYFFSDEKYTKLQFWINYMMEYTNCVYHRINTIGYTDSFKNYLDRLNIHIEGFDFDNIGQKEDKYTEKLFDILIAELSFNLNKIGYEIIGISVDEYSSIYYIIEKKNHKLLKNIDTGINIIDVEYLEKNNKEIYMINTNLEKLYFIEKGDYIQKLDNNDYITLFVKDNNIITNLKDEYIDIIL